MSGANRKKMPVVKHFVTYALSVFVALLMFAVIFYLLTEWLQKSPKVIEAAKTAAQIMGGSLFVLTAYYSWQTAKTASENAETAANNLLVAQKKLELDALTTTATIRVNEAKQISDRFTKATENLESASLST